MKYLKLFENFDEEESHEEGMCSRCKCRMTECDCPEMEEETYESKRSKKEETYKKSGLKRPEKADLDKNKKISGYEKARGKAIEKSMDEKPSKLTAAQKRLPEGLRKAIEAKKRK